MKKLSLVLALVVTVLFAQTAAANLVVNGGFEANNGSFDGWTLDHPEWTQINDGTSLPCPPHAYEGKYFADFGSVDKTTPNIITQTLATTIGQRYQFIFWLANEGTQPISNKINVAWDGTNLLTTEDLNGFGWTEYSYNVTATLNSTPITFSFYQVPAFFHLDAVSVDVVPLPGSLLLLASGLLPLGWRRLRKG